MDLDSAISTLKARFANRWLRNCTKQVRVWLTNDVDLDFVLARLQKEFSGHGCFVQIDLEFTAIDGLCTLQDAETPSQGGAFYKLTIV